MTDLTDLADRLISGKPISEFTPESYAEYVRGMYALRVRGKVKVEPAPGLSISQTKSGKLTVRMNKKKRAFAYVLEVELTELAKHYKVEAEVLREVFLKRKFIIASDRMSAELLYAG